MKHNYNFLITIIILLAFLTGCSKDYDVLLTNFKPTKSYIISNIEKEYSYSEFRTGDTIYFTLVTKDGFNVPTLRLQVIKLGDKVDIKLGCTLVQARDFNVDITKQYAQNYFCLYEPGEYILRIFSANNFNEPIAESYFSIYSF